MSLPIQVLVADQWGLNVRSLIDSIEQLYRSTTGNPVRVEVSEGERVDGTPFGTLRLVDRKMSGVRG